MILRSPLPRIHYYQNKRLQIKESQHLLPTYSWTLTLIPNWTCSIVTISPFQCTAPSSSHDEDHEVTWSQNPIITTQGKALTTSGLYFKRTSHNWGSLQLFIKPSKYPMWDSPHTHTHQTINQIEASQSPPLKSLTFSLGPTLRGSVSEPTWSYRADSDTIYNDPRKNVSHICAIPQKD